MNTEDIVGTWAKPRTMGEFSVMITAIYLHKSGRAAKSTFSYKPFSTLESTEAVLGAWKFEAGKIEVRLDDDSTPHILTYIPSDQMVVDYNGDKKVHKRLSEAEASLKAFQMDDDPTLIIGKYFETGESRKP